MYSLQQRASILENKTKIIERPGTFHERAEEILNRSLVDDGRAARSGLRARPEQQRLEPSPEGTGTAGSTLLLKSRSVLKGAAAAPLALKPGAAKQPTNLLRHDSYGKPTEVVGGQGKAYITVDTKRSQRKDHTGDLLAANATHWAKPVTAQASTEALVSGAVTGDLDNSVTIEDSAGDPTCTDEAGLGYPSPSAAQSTPEKMARARGLADVKLVVVESSFNEVMRAMYKVQTQEDEPGIDVQRVSTETPHLSNPVSPLDGQARPIRETFGEARSGAGTATGGTVTRSMDPTRNGESVLTGATHEQDGAGEAVTNLSPAIHDQAEDDAEPRISKTAPDEPAAAEGTPLPYDLLNAGTPSRRDEPELSATQPPPTGAIKEIKMMDTITFAKNFQPMQWIFTDLLGRIQYKEISTITVQEVIKAFLINLNHNQKQEFENDDLLAFLDKDSAH